MDDELQSNMEEDDPLPKLQNNDRSHQARYRNTLSIRPEEDQMSEGSEVMDGSVVSSVTDKYGFISGETEGVDPIVDVEILRRRESKWLEMLSEWDSYMMKNYKKVRERCRKGIPPSVRARAWLHLCGAKYQMENPENKNTFRKLCASRGEQRWTDDIEKDLHRNFPTHELFGGEYEKIGQGELFRVLKAYSVLNPVDGYCQAQVLNIKRHKTSITLVILGSFGSFIIDEYAF